MQWTESWWTSILHISEMAGSLWNFPQNVHKVGDFPFGIDLRSNDFRMHAHGDASSKGACLWFSISPVHIFFVGQVSQAALQK